MIDLSIDKEGLKNNIENARKHEVIIPTFEEMVNPDKISPEIKKKLKDVGMWDISPLNLYRTTWKNEPKEKGGQFGEPNYIELPKELTGVSAKIICLVGKWFPTGCHKVGSALGCLIPRLVTGQFDSTYHEGVWPSTGNYCRGGAYISKLLSCNSTAILPKGMSQERFDWLKKIASNVIATPGSESNVKEIFDKTWELRTTRQDVMIFNQFEEFGNYIWHYYVTGRAVAEVFEKIKGKKYNFAGSVFSTGSGGTIASGDYLKEIYPHSKLAVSEALQCPTILNNGFGEHRIEGIGDKHIPWIHNIKNTDMAIAIDDNSAMSLLRLFNEPSGKNFLKDSVGLKQKDIDNLSLIGISGICNILSAIKMAKYYELTENDVIATVLTDSVDMYKSRINELNSEYGKYEYDNALVDYNCHLLGIKTDNMLELSYQDRKRIHNLKYYTWIEQQGKDVKDLDRLWYDYDNTWGKMKEHVNELDKLINDFNKKVGLKK